MSVREWVTGVSDLSEDVITRRRWRVGRKVGRTIYAQAGSDPSDDDVLIGLMDTVHLAGTVVDAHNATRGVLQLTEDAYRRGREDAAKALLACTTCGRSHEYRYLVRSGLSTWADPEDGHVYVPAVRGAGGNPHALADIARGRKESE